MSATLPETLMIVAIFVCMVIFGFLVPICCKCENDEDCISTHYCYLCQLTVAEISIPLHRELCADSNRHIYNRLPKAKAACPRCNCWELIRVPKRYDGNNKFACKEKHCPSSGQEVANTGSNRYNCFHCNHDLCVNCLRLRSGPDAVAEEDSREASSSAAPAAAGSETSPRQETVVVVENARESDDLPPSYEECMKKFGDVV